MTSSLIQSCILRFWFLVFSFFLVFPQFVQGVDYKFKARATRPSNRNLLPSVGLSPSGSGAGSEASAITLRVLAIRVEFQNDDNPLTTGNGRFELVETPSRLLDVPPHNLSYFENQLLALKNYYQSVSRGQLLLETEVFPKDPASTYVVSQQMNYYVPVGDEELAEQRLAEFFSEAFTVADASGEINFANYDIFIIFHAGVGGDFAFDFDTTPQDMPSVFLDNQTLKDQLGNGDPDYQGVSVNNGAFIIEDGIVLPEGQSQDGLEFGMLGTMAIMLGNQLGLPLLFDPDRGSAGVGVFGLMDQGSGNFLGLVPAEPSAWEKVFLGWEIPIEVTSGTDLQVAVSKADNQNKIYKVPINDHEYFLIENRNRDLLNNGIAVARDANGIRIELASDGTPGSAEVRFDTTQVQSIGVITQVSEYDFGLPGSGILIWHIDEDIINANLAANRVNADRDHRGVDLEEASGAQDIGQFYGLLSPGNGTENGALEDMFWGSNIVNACVNHPNPRDCFDENVPQIEQVVQFTPFTTPSSRSNSGANSHIYITDFSEPDTVMTFSVANTLLQAGFPQSIDPTQSLSSPIIFDLDENGSKELLAAAGNRLYIWRADGTRFINNAEPTPVAAELGDRLFFPAIASLSGEHYIVASEPTEVVIFESQDGDSDGRLDVFLRFDFSADRLVAGPMAVNGSTSFEIYFGTTLGNIVSLSSANQVTTLHSVPEDESLLGFAQLDDGQIAFTTEGRLGVISASGGLRWEEEISEGLATLPSVGDLEQDGLLDIVAVSLQGRLVAFDANGNRKQDWNGELPPLNSLKSPVPTAPVIGNIDADPELEVVTRVFHGLKSSLVAYNHLGVLEDDFPILLTDSTIPSDSAPILVDLTGDGQAEIALNEATGMKAYNSDGEMVPGFPIASATSRQTVPYADDLDGDGDIEIAMASENGIIQVYDLAAPVSETALPWRGFYADATHSNSNLQSSPLPPVGGQLMPENSVYNYPNPTEGNSTQIRYTLSEDAEVIIKIFDLAGAFVDELTGPGFGRGENEVTWSLENIQSGVYFARVEAKGSRSQNLAIIKIAVVK